MSRQKEVKKLLESLADPDQRQSVANALAGSKPKLAVKTLSRALDLDDPVLRLRAIEMIEIIGSNEKAQNDSIDLMMQIARTDTDWGVRRQSTAALGNLNAEKAIPALIQRLIDEDPRVHEAAIDSLRKMGSKTLPFLQLELGNENPPFLKWRCIELLKILGIPNLSVIRQLIPFVNDSETIIRDEARAAIESFSTYLYEDLQRVMDLLDALDSNELEEDNIQVFFDILLSDKDAFKQAVKILAESGNVQDTRRLVELLKHYHPS